MAIYDESGTNTSGFKSSGTYAQWHVFKDDFNRSDEALSASADWTLADSRLNIVSNEVKRTRTSSWTNVLAPYNKFVPSNKIVYYLNAWGNRAIYPTPYLYFMRDAVSAPTKQYFIYTYYTGGVLYVRLYRVGTLLASAALDSTGWVNGKSNGRWRVETEPEDGNLRIRVYCGPSLSLKINYLDDSVDKIMEPGYVAFSLATEGTLSDRDMWADDFTVWYEKDLDPEGVNTSGFSSTGSSNAVLNCSGSNSFGNSNSGSGSRVQSAAGTNSFGMLSTGSGTTGTVYAVSGSNASGFSNTGSGKLSVTGAGVNRLGFSNAGQGGLVLAGSGTNRFGFSSAGAGFRVIDTSGDNLFGFNNTGLSARVQFAGGSNLFGFANSGLTVRALNLHGESSFGFKNDGVGSITSDAEFAPVVIPQTFYRVDGYRSIGDPALMIGRN